LYENLLDWNLTLHQLAAESIINLADEFSIINNLTYLISDLTYVAGVENLSANITLVN
jgi:hypothetical protein